MDASDKIKNFQQKNENENKIAVIDDEIEVPELDSNCQQRKVPSTRCERFMKILGLFFRVALRTLYNYVRSIFVRGHSAISAFLDEQNMELIVDNMCELRGTALKLGQIISMQDPKVVSPKLIEIFDRVRQRAYYMPDYQLNQSMIEAFGGNWKSEFAAFAEKPFAAASIGQVHKGKTHGGVAVAVKVQYINISKSIENDLNNLVGMLKMFNLFPPGLFIDQIIDTARRELAWEVDYARERDYQKKYRTLIGKYKEYYVPQVFDELSTGNVLTTELVPGVPIDKCLELDDEHRHFIASSMLKLVFVELFSMCCMQSDSNWSNFLYYSKTKTLMLLDFGATRFFNAEFIASYKEYLCASVAKDHAKLEQISLVMKLHTDGDNEDMQEAHLNMAMMFGEIFCSDEFDFGAENLSERFSAEVKKVIVNRTCPPPDEMYSINRKLSGVLSLCSKFKVKINCNAIFSEVIFAS